MRSSFFIPVAFSLGCLAFIFTSAFTGAPPVGSLTIRISGMDNSKGVVRAVLYDSEKSFLSENSFALADSAFAQSNGSVIVTLHNVPFGTYGAAFYQDENQNGIIDQNVFRIPTEPYAFSNGIRAKWTVPAFKDVAFVFNQPSTFLEVTLRKWSDQ